MPEHIREQLFAQYVISKTLALYITQDDFRKQVDAVVNDGYTFSMGGEKLSDFEQVDWKLSTACIVIARDMTEEYFNVLDEDEDDTDPQTDCAWR